MQGSATTKQPVSLATIDELKCDGDHPNSENGRTKQR